MAPRVTVIMPVFNAAPFVGEAIESIVSQDFADIEFLIIDDASTDGSFAILQGWAERDSRIVLTRNEVNRGVTASINAGLAAARGEYIARQDADDISMPGRLRREVEVLDADPGAAFVSTDYQLIDDRGAVLKTERRAEPPEIVEYLLHFENAVGGHSQVMFRTALARAAGGYDERRSTGQDYVLWTRLVKIGRGVILPWVGMQYRLHAEQVTQRPRDPESLARSRAFARGLVEEVLGRAVSEAELDAARSPGHRPGRTSDYRLANALHREAFERFSTKHGTRLRLQARLRRLTAGRFGVTAVLLFRSNARAAAGYLACGLRWHVVGALEGPVRFLCGEIAMKGRGLAGCVRRSASRKRKARIE